MAGGGGGAGRRRGAEPIGDLLAGFLTGSKLGRGVAREALEEVWREAVGPEVSASTRVRGFRDGVLAVEVASSALLQELSTFYRASILTALRAKKGPAVAEVREISFKLGNFDEPQPKTRKPPDEEM